MAENSKIEWCHHTLNPWRGCSKVSEGCEHCYACDFSKLNPGTLGKWGPQGTRVVAAEETWKLPLKWDRKAAKAGERHRVFCASFADVFEDWQGPMIDSQERRLACCHAICEWQGVDSIPDDGARWLTMSDVRARLFRVIDATPNLDWLLLTKRPENIAKMMPQRRPHSLYPGGFEIAMLRRDRPRPNVWLGVSVENQKAADERIPLLLQTPAAVRFLSVEPLLGPVDLRPKAPDAYSILGKFYSTGKFDHTGMSPTSDRVLNCFPRIDWVIVGGESGHGARPCNIAWVRSIVQQCNAAGVPCFVKQLGAYPLRGCVPGSEPQGQRWPISVFHWTENGQRPTLSDKKGVDMNEWPEDLRERSFPNAKQ